MPAGLAGDEPRLRQILPNLASKLIKLIDDCEVAIDISTERDDEDMGIGFAAQLIGRIGGTVRFGDVSKRGCTLHLSIPFTKAEVPQQPETQQGGRFGGP